MKKSIIDILEKRILVLDGGLGTQILKYNLKEIDFRKDFFYHSKKELKGFFELLSLTRPEIVGEIHEKYLKAGADIIETNTLRANSLFLEQYEITEISAYELNMNAAKIAREKVVKYTNLTYKKPRYLAGSVGPLPPEIAFEKALEFYTAQIKGLLAGNVDFILLETMTNRTSVRAAINALDLIMKKRNRKFAVAVSGTSTSENPSPVSLDFIKQLSEEFRNVMIFAIGENCGNGFEQVLQNAANLAGHGFYIIAYPNSMGKDGKEIPLEKQIEIARNFIESGNINIIGGCCGTDYHFIKQLSKIVK